MAIFLCRQLFSSSCASKPQVGDSMIYLLEQGIGENDGRAAADARQTWSDTLGDLVVEPPRMAIFLCRQLFSSSCASSCFLIDFFL